MSHSRWRRWGVVLATLIVADIVAARLFVRAYPAAGLPRAERVRIARLEHEAVERQYRVESAVYDHDLAPRFDGVAWWGPIRYHIRTNSLGFKDAATRAVPLETGRRRLLLLGDSFTEGLGLDYDDSYAGLIAKRAETDGAEVLNAAVTSYSPAIYYAKARYLLEDVGLRVTDLVVFIDISDIEDEARFYDLHADGRVTRMRDNQPGRGPEYGDTSNNGDFQAVPAALPLNGHRTPPAAASSASHAAQGDTESRIDLFLKRHSILVRAFDVAGESLRGEAAPATGGFPQANPLRPYWTIDDAAFQDFGRTGLTLAARHMDRLAELARRHGITLTVAVYPWPEQLRYDSANSIQVVFWRTWAQHRGARFVDLFAPLFGAGDPQSTIRAAYISGDVHFNKTGSRDVAASFIRAYFDTPAGRS
jgi:hypothetical protein